MLEPGPGQYVLGTGLNKTGIYFNRGYKNSGAPRFSRSKREGLRGANETSKMNPGPGTYKLYSEFGY